jgi:hypothetical protein
MAKKWIAVNLALLVVAGLLARQLSVRIDRFKSDNDLARLAALRPIASTVQADSGLPARAAPRRYDPAEFGVIAAQNPFSDLRGKPEEDTKAAAPEPPLQVKPVLVGVTIAGNQRLASIVDPTAPVPPGTVRRTQTKRLGEAYQGYTIVDISQTQMVLDNGRRREIIPLFDNTKARTGAAKTPILASRVVSFGAGAGGSSPAAGSAGAAPPRPAAPGAQAGQSTGQPASVNAQPSVRTTIPPPQNQTRQVPGNAPQQPTTWNERTDEQGRRVIRTPFGDIVRDKPNP